MRGPLHQMHRDRWMMQGQRYLKYEAKRILRPDLTTVVTNDLGHHHGCSDQWVSHSFQILPEQQKLFRDNTVPTSDLGFLKFLLHHSLFFIKTESGFVVSSHLFQVTSDLGS